jgi:hypothetical protein
MSKYDAELRRRLQEDDADPRGILRWFIDCLAKDPKIKINDFTDLEKDFCDDVLKQYAEWKQSFH